MGTTSEKLAKLAATKADLKAALAEKGQTVGDVFSAYPAAVRAIKQDESAAILEYDSDESGIAVYDVEYAYPNAYERPSSQSRVNVKFGAAESFSPQSGENIYHLWVKTLQGRYMLIENFRFSGDVVEGSYYNVIG